MNTLKVSSSPHFRHSDSTYGIMLDVIIALIPTSIAGIVFFGPRAALLLAVCVASAVLAEFVCCKVLKKKNSISDLSAAVTGLLLGLCLPPSLPFWMGALGSVLAIVVVKQLFGGLGQNFVNPAVTGRIVLMVSFPTAMTTWDAPFAWLNSTDAISSATPLVDGSAYSLERLLLGFKSGCIGETYVLALLAGGVYLVARRVISPVIPLSFIATTGIMMWLFGGDPLFHIMSGGLLLGAIFMATDYVTSPSNTKGQLIFGIGCGLITAIIRRFGALPEGVSYAILLMNILVPYIEKFTASKPFGWEASRDE